MEELIRNYKLKKSLVLFFFLMGLLVSSSAWAAKVVDIDFEGLVRVSESKARQFLSMVEGDTYSSRRVNQDIKSLYKSGLFQNIKAKKFRIKGGFRVTYQLEEKGFVKVISFEGNRKFDRDELLGEVLFSENSILDEQAVAESTESIRLLYEDKKYFLVEVDAKIIPYDTERNELEVVFHIKENRSVKIRRISFIGNQSFSDKELRKQMVTKVKGFLSFINGSGKYEDEKLERDIAFLGYFYQNNGFLKVKVGEPQLNLTRNKKSIYITIPIIEGDQYTVGQVNVSGDILTTREELLSKMELKPGMIYSRELQDKDSKKLGDLYGDQAYAFASVFPNIDTNESAKEANINYAIRKGYKVLIERIDIEGNLSTRDKVIRRELRIKENSPYRKTDLDKSRARLYQLGYFEEVNFSTPRGSQNDRVIVKIEVVEKSTGNFSIGAGFSSLEKFIFNAAIQKENLFGYGYGVGLATNISKLRQEFSFNFYDRYFLDTKWITSLTFNRFTSQLNRDFDRESIGGKITFGRELIPNLDVNLGYSIEDITISNFSSQVPGFFQQNADGLTSSVISSIIYDVRNNRLSTTKGMYHAVSSEYAGDVLGGSNEFWKMKAESRMYFSLPLNLVFKARGVFGYINSLDDTGIPLFERFFLGGISSLRGYDSYTVGPKLNIPGGRTGNDNTFVYGGNRMFFSNVELEYPIIKKQGLGFNLVAFFDSGQSFSENESFSIADFRSNYGFGFRWLSPFGPLRFEWGIPINKREEDSSSVFNFSIGQAF